MESSWKKCKLGDIITLKRGFDLPKQDRKSGSIPLVSSSGISDYINVAKIKGPGVITGRTGTIGIIHFIENDYWPHNTALYVEDFNGNDPLFIYYFLKTLDYLKFSDKAAVPGVNRNHLHMEDVAIPDLTMQKRISYILRCLDKKIQLLQEMNQTLESIAQALFKSWFVDFDPVRVKAEGRVPEGLDPEIAVLFPDEFEESKMRLVPKRWKSRKLGEIVSVKGGYAYKSSVFCETGNPVIKIKNIVGDGTISLSNADYINNDQSKRTDAFRLVDGDILIAMTGATIGKTGIIVTDNDMVPYLNQRVAKFISKLRNIDKCWFAFIVLQNDFMFNQVINLASGSAQANISTTGIESILLILPDNLKILEKFNTAISPLFLSWIENQKQIKLLSISRDLLLPRLISGQLRMTQFSNELGLENEEN